MTFVHTSVILMPESDDRTVCVTFRGIVTLADHRANLFDQMQARIEKYGYYNLVLYFHPDFRGYTPEAADSGFRGIRDMGRSARRIAYVNPTPRKLFQTQMTRALLCEEVRNFDAEELAEAIAWAKAAPETA
jgi:hypothetical protein